jgi:radical SAM-linked protein
MTDPDTTPPIGMAPAPIQGSLRHRITFGTARSLAYISVIELGAVWERTLRRAHVPLKYSQGFTPRPRMHFAAPLPVGCGTEADLLDIYLTEPWPAGTLLRAVDGFAPPDLTPLDDALVDENEPALSEQLTAAEYRIWITGVAPQVLENAVARFLDTDTVELPRRGGRHRGKPYNLRALVETMGLAPIDAEAGLVLTMRLSARAGATGRPDEVMKSLGLAGLHQRCSRTRLILSPTAP